MPIWIFSFSNVLEEIRDKLWDVVKWEYLPIVGDNFRARACPFGSYNPIQSVAWAKCILNGRTHWLSLATDQGAESTAVLRCIHLLCFLVMITLILRQMLEHACSPGMHMTGRTWQVFQGHIYAVLHNLKRQYTRESLEQSIGPAELACRVPFVSLLPAESPLLFFYVRLFQLYW